MPATASHRELPGEPLSRRLRASIQDVHARIEATPIARAMAEGTVSRPWYGALLAQLVPVHAAFEERLGAAGLGDLLDPRLVRRRELLERDRRVLGLTAAPAGPAARALIDRLGSAASPALIGVGYVIAGSSLGSQVLHPILVRALAVADRPGAGLDAHRLEPAVVGPAWAATRARLDALEVDRDAVVAGAVAGMTGLAELYAAVEAPP